MTRPNARDYRRAYIFADGQIDRAKGGADDNPLYPDAEDQAIADAGFNYQHDLIEERDLYGYVPS